MSNEIDKIGDLFRNTLKEHRMDSDDHLWDRLETQLSAQPPVSVPKTSGIRHLSWVKVAVAASFMVGVALAFNYIYLPLKNAKTITDTNKTIDKTEQNKPTESIIDSTSVENELQNQQILQSEKRGDLLISNPGDTELAKRQLTKPVTDNSDRKNPTVNNNLLPNYANNLPAVYQPNNPVVNTTQNPVYNNVNKTIPTKDSVFQLGTDHNFDRNPIEPDQNNIVNQNLSNNEDVIKDADIPNFFTPNFDGFNDYFVIRNLEKCTNNQLVIKDRNGNTVYEKINYQNDWDGRNVSDGVYFFFLKYKASGNNFGKYGSINIKR